MKKKIVIEIVFEEETDDFIEDLTFLDFSSMSIRTDETTLSDNERSAIAEGWAQSDWYRVGFNNSLIELVNGKDTITSEEIHY